MHVGLNLLGGLFGAKAPAADPEKKEDEKKDPAPAGTDNLYIPFILSNPTCSSSRLQLIWQTR